MSETVWAYAPAVSDTRINYGSDQHLRVDARPARANEARALWGFGRKHDAVGNERQRWRVADGARRRGRELCDDL